jgi:hypothetical protein
VKLTAIVFSILFTLLPTAALASYTEWINFDSSRGLIRLPVKVEGIDTYAILDTGANLNTISAAFIKKHQLTLTKQAKVSVQGVNSKKDQFLYDDVAISFMGLDSEIDGLAEMNLPDSVGGIIIGAGFFEQFIVQIDYPNSRLRLISRDSLDLAELENIEFLSQRGSGEPIVRVEMANGKKTWMLLDTGNAGGILVKRHFAEAQGWLNEDGWVDTNGHGANSPSLNQSKRIDYFKFGPFELADVLVSIPAIGQKRYVGDEYIAEGSRIRSQRVEGILGYDILKHFVLTIDYKYGHAHIGVPEA